MSVKLENQNDFSFFDFKINDPATFLNVSNFDLKTLTPPSSPVPHKTEQDADDFLHDLSECINLISPSIPTQDIDFFLGKTSNVNVVDDFDFATLTAPSSPVAGDSNHQDSSIFNNNADFMLELNDNNLFFNDSFSQQQPQQENNFDMNNNMYVDDFDYIDVGVDSYPLNNFANQSLQSNNIMQQNSFSIMDEVDGYINVVDNDEIVDVVSVSDHDRLELLQGQTPIDSVPTALAFNSDPYFPSFVSQESMSVTVPTSPVVSSSPSPEPSFACSTTTSGTSQVYDYTKFKSQKKYNKTKPSKKDNPLYNRAKSRMRRNAPYDKEELEAKRHTHNILEKRRREDMRSVLDDLKSSLLDGIKRGKACSETQGLDNSTTNVSNAKFYNSLTTQSRALKQNSSQSQVLQCATEYVKLTKENHEALTKTLAEKKMEHANLLKRLNELKNMV
eukprot:Awhi_evm1s8934